MNRAVYIRYQAGRIGWLLGGSQTDTSKVASVAQWHQRTNYLHSVAKAGCPFAASTMYRLEELLQELGSTIEKEIQKVKNLCLNSVVNGEIVLDKRYDMENYAPIAVTFVSILGKYDRLLHEAHVAMYGGELSHRDIHTLNGVIEKRIRRIKSRPYQYQDYGIRNRSYQGSLEWSLAVKKLGAEPEVKKYSPKFYLIDSINNLARQSEASVV